MRAAHPLWVDFGPMRAARPGPLLLWVDFGPMRAARPGPLLHDLGQMWVAHPLLSHV